LFALQISEGALDAMFRRAKPSFDNAVAAILARLRRSRIICSDETDGAHRWSHPLELLFQNEQVVIHVIRNSRAASVVAEVLQGHRPSIWVSDLYGAQQGHADLWQICLAHQLRDCQYAIEAGDTIFAPRMKMLLLRAVVLARRRKKLAESTRHSYQRRLDRELDAIMALAPTNQHGKRLRKRYGKNRSHLFTFLEHPDSDLTGGPICSPLSDRLSAPPRETALMHIRPSTRFYAAHRCLRPAEQLRQNSMAAVSAEGSTVCVLIRLADFGP
jgi:transposase